MNQLIWERHDKWTKNNLNNNVDNSDNPETLVTFTMQQSHL